jgi:hypothetical protein
MTIATPARYSGAVLQTPMKKVHEEAGEKCNSPEWRLSDAFIDLALSVRKIKG